LRLFSLRASNPQGFGIPRDRPTTLRPFFSWRGGLSSRLGEGQYSHPDHFHDRSRRYPDERASLKAGAIDFLSKPFRDQDMLGEQTRSGDVLILHRYALVWKILYQGIKQLFLLHNCRG
jgi:hypothetical protein